MAQNDHNTISGTGADDAGQTTTPIPTPEELGAMSTEDYLAWVDSLELSEVLDIIRNKQFVLLPMDRNGQCNGGKTTIINQYGRLPRPYGAGPCPCGENAQGSASGLDPEQAFAIFNANHAPKPQFTDEEKTQQAVSIYRLSEFGKSDKTAPIVKVIIFDANGEAKAADWTTKQVRYLGALSQETYERAVKDARQLVEAALEEFAAQNSLQAPNSNTTAGAGGDNNTAPNDQPPTNTEP